MNAILAVCYALYGAACTFLYYNMCVPKTSGAFHSDLPAHIQSGVSDQGYSFLEIFYKYICRFGIGSKVIPIVLAFLTLASIWMLYKIMKLMFPDGNTIKLHLLSFAANLEMPLYLAFLHPNQNMGLQSGSMWHNDTYLGMRFFGLLVLYFYFQHQVSYKETFHWKEWLAFAAALFMANFMKPNFLLCFAPVMGILLLFDLIKSKGKDLKSIFWFGLAVIPSLSILVFQSLRLFGEGTNGGSVALSFAYILQLRNAHPVFSILQSVAFPLLVLILHVKDLKSDRIFRTSWMIWLCGFLTFLFINQTGECINDGNFTWGYSFCLTLLFGISAAKTLADLKPKEKAARLKGSAELLLLLWHTACGIYFFIGLLQGLPYAR